MVRIPTICRNVARVQPPLVSIPLRGCRWCNRGVAGVVVSVVVSVVMSVVMSVVVLVMLQLCG